MDKVWKGVAQGKSLPADQLEQAAQELLAIANGSKVWLFFGEMGAGKTTLVKEICKTLGVLSGMSSPTFSIVNEYMTGQGDPVYHFDFYRLKRETEAYDIGVDEYFDSGKYCFVEWPERIPTLWPADFFSVRIRQDSIATRVIEYTAHG
jgi:tRNA threonylcarbamoyladenosine biosynthesis protein TsaE